MDHIQILKRAWKITWNYRVLWLFGFLLALTTGGGSGGGGGSSGYRMDESDLRRWFPGGEFNMPGFSQTIQEIIGAAVSLFIVFACLGIILAIAFTIARYVSETALFRMVNRYEEDEHKFTIKEGFRLGWSRSAFNLFLMDLILGLAGFILFTLLLLIAAIPLLTWLVDNDVLRTIGTVASASFGLMVLFLAILTSIGLGLILQFARRVCVLENRGVIEALQEGFNMVRTRLSDSVIMGLILFGVGIAFAILMIPVMILLFVIAAIMGGLPGLLTYWIASRFLEGAAPYLVGIAIALPFFLLVVTIPSSIIGGIFETLKSSVWTLTFREFRSHGKKLTDETPTAPESYSTVLLPETGKDQTARDELLDDIQSEKEVQDKEAEDSGAEDSSQA